MTSIQKLSTRFELLEETLKSDSFLKMEGLNNEIPFFVFAHHAEEQISADIETTNLIARLRTEGLTICHIDLYDTAIEILKRDEIFSDLLDVEPDSTKEELKETLQNITDPETEFVPAMIDKMASEPFDILFLTGAGLVFPFMRSHAVLNNLQSVVKDRPVLLFFPGEYTFSDGQGQSLDLFGKLNEDKYYRAYNISNLQH